MVWQAIIDNVIQDTDASVVEVTYTDNVSQKVKKEYRLTTFDLNSFKRTVQSQIDQLSSVDTVKVNIPLGAFDTTIVPPEPPTPPDPTPKQLFSRDLQLLLQMNRAIALNIGLLDPSTQVYTDQVSKVKSGFNILFVDVF